MPIKMCNFRNQDFINIKLFCVSPLDCIMYVCECIVLCSSKSRLFHKRNPPCDNLILMKTTSAKNCPLPDEQHCTLELHELLAAFLIIKSISYFVSGQKSLLSCLLNGRCFLKTIFAKASDQPYQFLLDICPILCSTRVNSSAMVFCLIDVKNKFKQILRLMKKHSVTPDEMTHHIKNFYKSIITPIFPNFLYMEKLILFPFSSSTLTLQQKNR